MIILFGFSKKKNDVQTQTIQQPLIPNDYQKPEFLGNDILNPKRESLKPMPEMPADLMLDKQELDFDTIEIKTRPNMKGAYQLATFSDLSSFARRTPIFVFRDKKQNTYFGVVEGKIFYLKK